MSGGGTVHQSYGMNGPGSAPIDGTPQGFELEDLANVMAPDQATPGTDRNRISPDGGRAPEKDAPFPQSGAFAQADTEDGNAALWKKTASSS